MRNRGANSKAGIAAEAFRETQWYRSVGDERSLDDLLGIYPLLAGEDPQDFETLRLALLSDLAPRSPYAQILAGNLVELEWERVRYRRLIREIVMQNARAALAVELSEKKHGTSSRQREQYLEAFGGSRTQQQEVAVGLEALGIDVAQLVASAWAEQTSTIVHLELQLHDAEKRRRLLLDDFEAVQARSGEPIPEAELIGATDG